MIHTKKDLKYYLLQDRKANNITSSKWTLWMRNIIDSASIYNFLRTLRYTEYYTNNHSLFDRMMLMVYKIKLKKLSRKLGYSIPVNTCGPGLSLPHYGTIIINSKARLGSFCRLHTCVNIGASGGGKKAPQIGDNVYIGPSAVIFGDIAIANNVTIGANATVNKSCHKPNVVLAGTPAIVVKENALSWIEFNNVNLDIDC